MKISKRAFRLSSFVGIAVAQTAFAMPVGVTQTSELCRTADVIVAASCDHTVSKMRASFSGGKADDTVYLIVERILKNNTGRPLSNNLNFWSGRCADVSASIFEEYTFFDATRARICFPLTNNILQFLSLL
ncbi:MAG TPA: hypothetical protein EYN91_00550 [Candidatus Melainabacteria bacterium]|nr:hypothetical protein [Candidatus Melainabacteria bacterium]